MPHYGAIQPRTAMALAGTATDCVKAGVTLDIYMVQCVLPWARDNVIDEFLNGTAQKLFWIDSDMDWPPAAFFRLLALSQVRDVVGAAYPAKIDPRGPMTFYASYEANLASEEYGLMRVNGMGLGFTVMDRKVVEKIAEKAPHLLDELSGKRIRTIFRFAEKGGKRQGEDMAFFDDIRALGFDVWMDPSVELGHIGTHTWRGKIADVFQQAEMA